MISATSKINSFLYQLRLDLIFALGAGLAWAIWVSRVGMGYSPDSIEYVLSAARLGFSGEFAMLPVWPPLFPSLIALLSILLPFPAVAAEALVGFCAMGLLVAFALNLRLFSQNVLLNIVFILLLLTLPPFFSVGTMAWSEIPYTFVSLLAIFFFLRFQREDRIADLYIAFAFASIAMMTRYVGVILLPTLTIGLLLNSKNKNRPPLSLRRLFLLNFTASAPLVIYLARNQIAFGSFTGSRVPVDRSLLTGMNLMSGTFVNDFFLPLLLLFFLAVGFILIHTLRYEMWKKSPEIGVWLAYCLMHLAAILYFSTFYRLDEISTRLLFPIYPIFLLFSARALTKEYAGSLPSKLLRIAMTGLLLSLVVFSIIKQGDYFIHSVGALSQSTAKSELHIQEGYAVSATSASMANAFEEMILDNSILHAYIQMPNDRASRIFFLQNVPYRGLSLSSIDYSNVERDGFSVAIGLSDGSISILEYALIADFPDAMDLTMAIQETNPEGESFVIVFSDDSAGLESLDSVISNFSANYEIESLTIPPYEIVYFSSRNPLSLLDLGNQPPAR